jgi:hypothetical protein
MGHVGLSIRLGERRNLIKRIKRIGFVLQEVSLPFRDESELAAMTGAIMD